MPDKRHHRGLAPEDAEAFAPETLRGRELWLDGFNVLLTLEVALSGGVLLPGRDGCIRDMAGVHGSYRNVEETPEALERVGRALERLGVARAVWYLDRPVSNSGRLGALLAESATAHGWPWRVELEFNPDRVLAEAPAEIIVASADSAVLDRCGAWFNLVRYLLEPELADCRVVAIL